MERTFHYDRVGIDQFGIERLFSAEKEQMPHQFAATASRLANDPAAFTRFLQRRDATEHFGVTENRVQQIVEVVRDAGRQLADRLHFLRLLQFGLQSLQLADFKSGPDKPVHLSVFVPAGDDVPQDTQRIAGAVEHVLLITDQRLPPSESCRSRAGFSRGLPLGRTASCSPSR